MQKREIRKALSSNAQDSDGDLITNDVEYAIFILSIADGSNANVNAMSKSSTTITLLGEPTFTQQSVMSKRFSIYQEGDYFKILCATEDWVDYISLYDITGKEVLRKRINNHNSEYYIKKPSSISSMYILQVKSKDEATSFKLSGL